MLAIQNQKHWKEMIDTPNLKLQYEGSVKNVFARKNDTHTLWFSFTDKYSVFDWGKMPDLIANKGNALALIGAYIFQRLSDANFWQKLPQSNHLKKFDASYLQKRFAHPVFSANNGLKEDGLPSHFLGLYEGIGKLDNWQTLKMLHAKEANKNTKSYFKDLDLKNQLLMHVLAAEVGWPEHRSIMHENLYFYPAIDKSARRLIPLEVVFSFGLLEGSSLKRKLDEDPLYSTHLGLTSSPKLNQWFVQPTLQFFSKLEPKDRLLSWQEATTLANLSGQQFEQLVELAIDTALALHVLFAERGLDLWDGKLEFIFDPNQPNQLLLADCVGPDEVRLLYKNIHLSKELLRQHYRPTAWYKSLATARNLAIKNGREDWQQICRDELKQSPQPLPPELKTLASQLYGMLANEMIAETIFPSHPNLKEFAGQLEKTLAGQKKEHINA